MWPIIIVLLVLAMLIGPVMLMQPSKAQKRLAALRQQATTLGLKVGASNVKAPDGAPCWAYWLPVTEQNALEPVLLERKNYEHGLHIAKYWFVKQGSGTKLPAPVASVLLELPSSVHMLELNEHAIGVHWTEHGGSETLEQIAGNLRAMSVALS
ncbi:hypothetical protein [Marinagarivorans cellulosilyticus]|uniref:Uncharacterized protein n=1 Tax=Marinagarivorans cellulosilyticus TaxID=2721545 RepID=A0AAN2BKX3_9GAMM|nr:hypothetical protein [Marinagarivorans cellulosilyticus]BCD98415.1 hypothetical protein MARGE09_P2616 [Marinagarivorans cellulosilyticus]